LDFNFFEMTNASNIEEGQKDHNKKYLHEKTRCECGTVVSRISLARHRRTKKHENKLRHLQYLEDCENEK
jgi:hypothetical protein